MNPLLLFWLLLKASLFSTGGMGNVPSLHSDLTARGWAHEHDFAESMAVGQISPGPSGLWVISLGYLVDGLRGALLALVAICLPPLLVVPVERIYDRVKDHPAVEGFVRGLSLAVVGVFVVTLQRLISGTGSIALNLLLAAACFGLGLIRRLPVIVILLMGAFAGLLLYPPH